MVPEVSKMTDREIAEETLIHLRKVDALVSQFFDDFKSGKINPMQMLTGMFSKGK